MKKLTLYIQSAFYSATALIISGCATSSIAPGEEIDPRQTTARVEVHADHYLKEMGEFLKEAQEFTFKAESSYDALDHSGQNIRYGGKTEVALQRPNMIYSAFTGDERQTRSYYNDKTFTVYNVRSEMYAEMEVPPVIDDAIDTIMERLGISLPLADLLYTDPYSILIENVIEGRWVGLHAISGVPCNHLAFSQETVDWQIWIEAGEQPVPRQVLITYKDEPGSPRYLARLYDWNLKPKFKAKQFEFTPPEGAGQIEFMTIPEEEDAK